VSSTRPTPASDLRWLTADEQSAWRAFLDMHSRLTTQLNREMQEQSGLSTADFAVLVQLSEHPDGRMRVLELARALRWEKSRLSHQLTRMARRDLLERSNCSADRRGAFVVLSPEGRAAVERAAPAHVESVRRYLFDGLSAEVVDSWAAVSQHVVERLAESGEACATDCAAADDDQPDAARDTTCN
jgi:DNA-binding MarR family transcriptional regulator